MFDLVRQTNHFYALTREKLDGVLNGIYQKLTFHFMDSMGVDGSHRQEYGLSGEGRRPGRTGDYAMLKRNNIAESAQKLELRG